ncbi:MAG TPA: acetyl-CoA hydrolase/transferase C-terminal domain-containing protein [Acidimicrobiales bacterium]|nr:acetyl-CoA hydrolase/transferase C-terminal domain-containing protein [Acidimicrobiales bacterium]
MEAEPALRQLLRPGARLAWGDGCGSPNALAGDVSRVAHSIHDIDLVLGWVPSGSLRLDLGAFASVRTFMGGYGLRGPIDDGRARYVVCRLGATPALLHGALRPDVLVASVRRSGDGHRFTTESAWQRAAVDAGAVVVAVERPGAPGLEDGPVLPSEQLVIVGSSDAPPIVADWGEPSGIHRGVAERVVPLIPPGSRVQYGPGAVGTAVLDALGVAVEIDTGMLTDAVVDLDARGLLAGRPLAPYAGGSERLYDWAEGRACVARFELTHDPVRLAGAPPLVAVNTALEIDVDGQVNVESVGGSAVAGIGGHPDYAFGAGRSIHGTSIVALPTVRGEHPTLVEQLSCPASTASHDVDMVVTELGVADLRGRDRRERRRAITALWGW